MSPFAATAEPRMLQWLDSTAMGQLPGMRAAAQKIRVHRGMGLTCDGATDEAAFQVAC
ncbi:hypothetical protein AB0D04_13325 [Streptomyces sp. NPDC048483]|uniref:hypothetical protein n=1 Tax=Streptomyces sp. NPDC048483 TaxID=3154927 RepID=UPI0034420900